MTIRRFLFQFMTSCSCLSKRLMRQCETHCIKCMTFRIRNMCKDYPKKHKYCKHNDNKQFTTHTGTSPLVTMLSRSFHLSTKCHAIQSYNTPLLHLFALSVLGVVATRQHWPHWEYWLRFSLSVTSSSFSLIGNFSYLMLFISFTNNGSRSLDIGLWIPYRMLSIVGH